MQSDRFFYWVIRLIIVYLLTYVVLTFVNLTFIPVAWVDETYFFDPAIQVLKTGRLSSKVWHVAGTENFLFAYLPFIFLMETVNLSVFPWEMFYVRLPFVLFFFAGMYYYFRLMKDVLQMDLLLALIVLFLFINDKGISESLRSVRIEPVELFFIPLLLWRILKSKDDIISSLLLSLLFLCHPKSWGIVAVLGLFIFFRAQSWKNKSGIVIAFLIPVCLFLAYAKFDFHSLYSQLFLHAEEHDVSSGNLFYNHFITRFWPYYNIQPYVPFIFYSSLIISFYAIWKKRDIKGCLIEICFVLSNIYWFFTLDGFSRYNPILLLFAYVILGAFLQQYIPVLKKNSSALIFGCLFVPVACFPFLSRHAAALIQREERDIDPMLEWYKVKLQNVQGLALVIGESSAHYYSLDKTNLEYSTFYSIGKFHFADYKEIYVSSVVPFRHAGLDSLTIYKPHQVSLIKESGSAPVTYYGTILYKLKSEEAFEYLKALYGG